MVPKRYDVHWVTLDPGRGSELRKTRPAVVVSLDVLNRALATVVVCPLTTQLHPTWRSRVPIKIAGTPAEIAADQIRARSAKPDWAEKLDRSPLARKLRYVVCWAKCTPIVELSGKHRFAPRSSESIS